MILPAGVATGRDRTGAGYWVALGDYFGRGSFFWSRISADRERGSGADLFYCGVALFDADGDLGLLRGGRIGAD